MDYTKLSDKELVKLSLEKDDAAYAEIIERYKRKMFSIAYKHCKNYETSLDLSQEIFAKVYLKLDRYKPSYRFSTWIIRVGTNHCIDYLRKRRLQTISYEHTFKDLDDQYSDLPIPDESYNPEMIWEDEEMKARLLEAIDDLPETYREIIILRHYEEMSYKKIARVMDIPIGTVMTYLYRARNMLKDKFFGED